MLFQKKYFDLKSAFQSLILFYQFQNIKFFFKAENNLYIHDNLFALNFLYNCMFRLMCLKILNILGSFFAKTNLYSFFLSYVQNYYTS